MMKQIRTHVFETNSSSAHTLTIDTSQQVKPKFKLTKNIKIKADDEGLGFSLYDGDICDDFHSKLLYLICYAGPDVNNVKLIVEVAKQIAKEQGIHIYFDKEIEEGTYVWDDWYENKDFYINHQSSDCLDWLFNWDPTTIKKYVYAILTDDRIVMNLWSDATYDGDNIWSPIKHISSVGIMDSIINHS